jgi:hypothetical protein
MSKVIILYGVHKAYKGSFEDYLVGGLLYSDREEVEKEFLSQSKSSYAGQTFYIKEYKAIIKE